MAKYRSELLNLSSKLEQLWLHDFLTRQDFLSVTVTRFRDCRLRVTLDESPAWRLHIVYFWELWLKPAKWSFFLLFRFVKIGPRTAAARAGLRKDLDRARDWEQNWTNPVWSSALCFLPLILRVAV